MPQQESAGTWLCALQGLFCAITMADVQSVASLALTVASLALVAMRIRKENKNDED